MSVCLSDVQDAKKSGFSAKCFKCLSPIVATRSSLESVALFLVEINDRNFANDLTDRRSL